MSTQKAATELEMIIFVINDDSGTVVVVTVDDVVDSGEVEGINGCSDDVIVVAVTVPGHMYIDLLTITLLSVCFARIYFYVKATFTWYNHSHY